MLRIGVLFSCVIQIAGTLYAQSVTLAWDRQAGLDLAGYNIYRADQSGRMPLKPLNSAPLKSAGFTDSTVQYNRTYYYAVKAVGVKGGQSRFSNEIKVTIGPAPIKQAYGLIDDRTFQDAPATDPKITTDFLDVPAQADARSGLAVVAYHQNGKLVSEAVLQGSRLMRSGRIHASVDGPLNTGIAMGNPQPAPVRIDFYFTDASGATLHSGSTWIASNGNFAAFLREAPFAPPADLHSRVRTWTFSASSPIAVSAVRTFTNERSDFLMAPLPIGQLDFSEPRPQILPHYADGGAWQSELQLVNPTDSRISGLVRSFPSVDSSKSTDLTYEIPPRSAVSLSTTPKGEQPQTGWIVVNPHAGTAAPLAALILSYSIDGLTVSQTSIHAMMEAVSFDLYGEVSGSQGSPGAVQTTFVISNSASQPAHLKLQFFGLNGERTGRRGTLTIDAAVSTTLSMERLMEIVGIPIPFKGLLRIEGGPTVSIGLKSTRTERGDFLITAVPAISHSALNSSEPMFLFFASGRGYTTNVVPIRPTPF
jgi:hypothetical protein